MAWEPWLSHGYTEDYTERIDYRVTDQCSIVGIDYKRNPILAKPITPEQLASSNSEDGHQAALFCQVALHYESYPMLRWMHAIPNGGSRHFKEAQKLVGTGTRSGVLDIFLPYSAAVKPNTEDWYCGLYIEMKAPERIKAKNGGLTDEQIQFMTYAVVAGYKCVVCYSWQQAWDEVLKYLNGE